MTRAMTLIKTNFIGLLRAISSEILKGLSEKEASPTAPLPAFQVGIHDSDSIARRTRATGTFIPDELSALLAECHYAYFQRVRAF
jgi:hypothetical protein